MSSSVLFMGGFAVVDFETTGLHPGYHHRVVEVGVVILDEQGVVVGEYETVVNPGRDLGAQDIHGISAADARLAPLFGEIAGDLLELLAGRIFVAHHANFDLTFLAAEYARSGHELPPLWDAAMCTMLLSDHYLDGHTRTLAGCCEAVGVPYVQAHHALSDARAAAALLRVYLEAEPDAPWWSEAREAAEAICWPSGVPVSRKALTRGASAIGSDSMDVVIRALERVVEPPYHAEYFALVDMVLADGKVTLTERRALNDFAMERGLGREDITGLNRSYMMAVVRACTNDQILTQAEKARIIQFATLLEVDELDVMGLLAIAVRDSYAVDGAVALKPRDEIVLTGMSDAEKSELSTVAEGLGVLVGPRVKRGCRVVVAKDAESQSGKARRARELGIPVIDVATFEASVERLRGLRSAPG